jgi:hypothetical protein
MTHNQTQRPGDSFGVSAFGLGIPDEEVSVVPGVSVEAVEVLACCVDLGGQNFGHRLVVAAGAVETHCGPSR